MSYKRSRGRSCTLRWKKKKKKEAYKIIRTQSETDTLFVGYFIALAVKHFYTGGEAFFIVTGSETSGQWCVAPVAPTNDDEEAVDGTDTLLVLQWPLVHTLHLFVNTS